MRASSTTSAPPGRVRRRREQLQSVRVAHQRAAPGDAADGRQLPAGRGPGVEPGDRSGHLGLATGAHCGLDEVRRRPQRDDRVAPPRLRALHARQVVEGAVGPPEAEVEPTGRPGHVGDGQAEAPRDGAVGASRPPPTLVLVAAGRHERQRRLQVAGRPSCSVSRASRRPSSAAIRAEA